MKASVLDYHTVPSGSSPTRKKHHLFNDRISFIEWSGLPLPTPEDLPNYTVFDITPKFIIGYFYLDKNSKRIIKYKGKNLHIHPRIT